MTGTTPWTTEVHPTTSDILSLPDDILLLAFETTVLDDGRDPEFRFTIRTFWFLRWTCRWFRSLVTHLRFLLSDDFDPTVLMGGKKTMDRHSCELEILLPSFLECLTYDKDLVHRILTKPHLTLPSCQRFPLFEWLAPNFRQNIERTYVQLQHDLAPPELLGAHDSIFRELGQCE